MKSIFLKLLIILGTLFVYLLLTSDNAGPDSFLGFPVKRAQEKVFLSIQSSPQDKANYYTVLLDRRLAEIERLEALKRSDLYYTASLRYATTAGELTELLIANKMSGQANKVTDTLSQHKIILKEISNRYPKNKPDEDYKFIEDAINYLDIYSQQLRQLTQPI